MFLPSTLHVTKWLPVLGMKRINSTVAINSHRVAEVPTKSVVLPSSRSLSDQSSDLTLLRYTLGKLAAIPNVVLSQTSLVTSPSTLRSKSDRLRSNALKPSPCKYSTTSAPSFLSSSDTVTSVPSQKCP